MLARGHHVTVVCGSYGAGTTGLLGEYFRGVRRGLVDGIDVIEFHLPYANSHGFLSRTVVFLKFMWRASRLVLVEDYDLVFATSTPLTVAVPGILAKILTRRKFVFEVRDLWPELPREMGVIKNPLVLWAMGVLESAAYRYADACIALAPGIEKGIRTKAASKPIAVIPNGSDLWIKEGGAELGQTLQELLQRFDDKTKCVFTGAHGIANGLDAVLDAAIELKRKGRRDIVLLFIGDGMMKPSLLRRAQEESLENCIFLDPIPKRELATMLTRVDVGLMILANVPAFYNGTSPNKFFDYLSAGLPVLTNYPGWLAEFVEREHCGIVVPPDDPKTFCIALERLADFPSERQAMGARARQLAERQFSREALAHEFVTFLESVVNGKTTV